MNITRAIEELERFKKKYGESEVYFDCPNCKQSFTPSVVVNIGMHMKEPDKK
jgi:hypothetical protein